MEFVCILQNIHPSITSHHPTMLPSEGLQEEAVIMDAVGIRSIEGEYIKLDDKVCLLKSITSNLVISVLPINANL